MTGVTEAHVSVAACRFLWGSLRPAPQRCLFSMCSFRPWLPESSNSP